MAIKFGRFIIESHNPQKLYHFLSFIFDVEANEVGDGDILFDFEDLKFLLRYTTKKIQKKFDFSIEVDSLEELSQLSQSIEFYYYKEGEKVFKLNLSPNSLLFSDPDGRSWLVELSSTKNLKYHKISKEINDLRDVRIC